LFFFLSHSIRRTSATTLIYTTNISFFHEICEYLRYYLIGCFSRI
jgi:hypothetical protein